MSEKPQGGIFLTHTVSLRNQKYYIHMGRGWKMDVVPFYRNWREKWNMAVKTEKNSCGIAQFPCGSAVFLLTWQFNL